MEEEAGRIVYTGVWTDRRGVFTVAFESHLGSVLKTRPFFRTPPLLHYAFQSEATYPLLTAGGNSDISSPSPRRYIVYAKEDIRTMIKSHLYRTSSQNPTTLCQAML